MLADPKHPYTRLLLSVPDPRAPLEVDAAAAKGEPPRVIDPVPGCRFRWRCPLAIDICHTVTPLPELLAPDHRVACHVAAANAGIASDTASADDAAGETGYDASGG